MASGIYSITHESGKRYIGSAVNLRGRWSEHRFLLLRGTHHSRHLQSAFDKYGADAFVFEVLEECDREFLVSSEQWWMNMLRPEYNISPRAGNCCGRRWSEETRANHPIYHHTEQAKEKIASAFRGKTLSSEHRAKISEALKGHNFRPGYKHTAETRAKISAGNKGKKRPPVTEETMARLSAAQTLSWANNGNRGPIGYRHTEEARAKMSAASKRWWAEQKGKV